MSNESATANRAFNISEFLPQRAREAPDRAAVICSHKPDERGRTRLTFGELDAESDQVGRGLFEIGIRPRMRVLLMVPPGLDFVTLTFALFKLDTIPVLIDPGMGGKNLLNCIRRSRPDAVIGAPLLHALRVVTGSDAFDSAKINVTAGRRWFWGGKTLRDVRRLGAVPSPLGGEGRRERSERGVRGSVPTPDSGTPHPALASLGPPSPSRGEGEGNAAAILFTTGSTGIPKGVVYAHEMFRAQVELIRDYYGIQSGEVDLPAFPLFALFSAALGTTCVIPDMNPTRPAQCDPEKIVRAIQEHNVTYTFGSPAIWDRVGPYCKEKNITLPSLKRILMAGAPVRGSVLEPFKAALPNGDTFIPYGATESLPIANIRGSEVLAETWALTRQGKGYCVGRPLPGIIIRVIEDEPVDSDCKNVELRQRKMRDCTQGEIGEIIVSGPVVTREYFDMPAETAKAKIIDHHGVLWHRMGDMGYFDEKGRLWFCGRKAHRVVLENGKVLYSVCCEARMESYLGTVGHACRAALVGIGVNGMQRAAMILEDPMHGWRITKIAGVTPYEYSQMIMREWMEKAGVSGISEILAYPRAFPVDIRHNAKIHREELAKWAEKQVAAKR